MKVILGFKHSILHVVMEFYKDCLRVDLIILVKNLKNLPLSNVVWICFDLQFLFENVRNGRIYILFKTSFTTSKTLRSYAKILDSLHSYQQILLYSKALSLYNAYQNLRKNRTLLKLHLKWSFWDDSVCLYFKYFNN